MTEKEFQDTLKRIQKAPTPLDMKLAKYDLMHLVIEHISKDLYPRENLPLAKRTMLIVQQEFTGIGG